jgi:hypothetical protein
MAKVQSHALSKMADMSNGIGPAIVHHVAWGGGENFPGKCALSISFEKGECDIW